METSTPTIRTTSKLPQHLLRPLQISSETPGRCTTTVPRPPPYRFVVVVVVVVVVVIKVWQDDNKVKK